MNYDESINLIDKARELFGNGWIKCRREISWKGLIKAIDKVERGEKLRWPFRIKRNKY